MNNIKRFLVFLLLLFLMPIIIGQLPFPNNEHLSVQVPNEQQLVYASSNLVMPSKRVLIAFTHSHEAYPAYRIMAHREEVCDCCRA